MLKTYVGHDSLLTKLLCQKKADSNKLPRVICIIRICNRHPTMVDKQELSVLSTHVAAGRILSAHASARGCPEEGLQTKTSPFTQIQSTIRTILAVSETI